MKSGIVKHLYIPNGGGRGRGWGDRIKAKGNGVLPKGCWKRLKRNVDKFLGHFISTISVENFIR